MLRKLEIYLLNFNSIYIRQRKIVNVRDKVMESMLKKEILLVRKKTIPRFIDKIMVFIKTLIVGIAA
jgi:hypothetical protein